MSKFTMPVAGTPEFDALKDRWSAKPVTFGQCSRIKVLFKQVNDAGGYAGKVNAKYQDRLDYLSTRNDEGRWTVLRTDNADLHMSMWQAHLLMETLESLANGDLAVAKTPAKPVKAKPENIPAANAATFKDGDIVLVNGEAKRISVNGKRAYLAAV